MEPEYRVRAGDHAAVMSFDMFKAIPYERVWKLLHKPNAR
jgi:hypothetical protein